MSGVTDTIRYWYFRVPKWVWASVVFMLIILGHAAVGLWFPELIAGDGGFFSRLLNFYLVALIVFLVGGIGLFVVVGGWIVIYEKLPDDPRKQKGSDDDR